MKHFILILLTSILALYSFTQSSVSQNNDLSKKSENRQWNLDKYVWSNTHRGPALHNKSFIDYESIDNFPVIYANKDCSISPNGEFCAYGITRKSTALSHGNLDTLIVKSTNGSGGQSITDVQANFFQGIVAGFFSGDSRNYIFKSKEGLCLLRLENWQNRIITGVESCKLPTDENKEWIASQLANNELLLLNLITGKEKRFSGISGYGFDEGGKWLNVQSNNESKELTLYNLVSGEEKRFQNIESYLFDKHSQSLLLKTVERHDGISITSLKHTNLFNGQTNTIWSTQDSMLSVNNYNIDADGTQIVFVVTRRELKDGARSDNSIWYWKARVPKAVMRVDNQNSVVTAGFSISAVATFSDNGRYIQFGLEQVPDHRKPTSTTSVVGSILLSIWSSQDTLLQCLQPHSSPKLRTVIMNNETGQFALLKEFEDLKQVVGDVAVILKSNKSIYGDRFWEKDYDMDSCWLMSLKDGSRKYISRGRDYGRLGYCISPGNNYLVYFDADKQCNYFSYELSTGRLIKISTGIPIGKLGFRSFNRRANEKPKVAAGIAGWLQSDKGLLVYDNFDIWLLDLTGKNKPVNVTNGAGEAASILFCPLNGDRGINPNQVFSINQTLLLKAFNSKNKFSGYYQKQLCNPGDPQLLFMGPYSFQSMANAVYDRNGAGMEPLRARDANVWLVQRQSEKDAPNYFFTADFKTFKALSRLEPQKQSNWLTAELHAFKQLDGARGEGILYKPANFDPSKKYPVLIVYYNGLMANSIYVFTAPAYNPAATGPAYSPIMYLNNDYLVFIPNFNYGPPGHGPTAFNAIEAAAEYLRHLPFVDGKHMGTAGHSWSAKLAAYAFTHSKSFAATAISEGYAFSDPVSLGLSDGDNFTEPQLQTIEVGFEFGNIWKNKATFLDQTTVLNLDKVKSALLVSCGAQARDFLRTRTEQTVELFNGLRRLEKKAWWLEYDEEDHNFNGANSQDYTLRYLQFFDHYLKDAPAPRWMTKGIPYKLKGVEARYELDPAGSCGKDCKICKAWNKQYKKDPKIFDKAISEWHLDQKYK